MPGAEIIDAQVALWRALQAGDRPRVDRIYGPVCALVAMQTSLDAYLAVEKYLLVKQGVFRNAVVRDPVGYRLDDGTRRQVDHWFDRLREALTS
jgi:4-hydroxy-tetrahydrodipicolinate synthase